MAESGNKFEIDFFGVSKLVLKRWKTVLASAFACAVVGAVYALITPSVYMAEAMIAPKDNQAAAGGAASFFAQVGAVSSMISSQLSAQNSNLDRMEVLVQSPEIARKVILENDLLPRLYPNKWNPLRKAWKKEPPNLRLAVDGLRTGNLAVVSDARKKTLTLTFFAPDSVLASDLAFYYLKALNAKIQEDTRSDADSNRAYLEIQLESTQDPALRAQIQNMIATEIGKSMLVSTKTFDILEYPEVPLAPIKPQRRKIVVGAFVFGGLIASAVIASLVVFQDRKKKA